MNNDEKIEREIRQTLDQFDQARPLPPNPYFYTRVQARLAEKRGQRTVFANLLKPALLAVLLAMNVGTAVWYMNGSEQTYLSDSRQELAGILAADLKLDIEESSVFLFEEE